MRSAALLGLVLCAGCPPTPQPAPSPPDAGAPATLDASDAAPAPPPAPEAAPPPAPADDCSRAEANLLKLGCKDSRGRLVGGPNLHGVPFATVCRGWFEGGVDVHVTAACLAAAPSCQGVSSCSL